jgi:hypothetical protein
MRTCRHKGENGACKGASGLCHSSAANHGDSATTHLIGVACCLALLIKRHHHQGGAVPLDDPCLLPELVLSLLEGNGIYNALALPTGRQMVVNQSEHLARKANLHTGKAPDIFLCETSC